MASTKPSAFDNNKGFTVTNNTSQNVYLQTATDTYEKIEAGKTSKAQTAYQSYPLLNNDSSDAAVYLTVNVDDSDGSVKVTSGTQKGSFVVTSNFK